MDKARDFHRSITTDDCLRDAVACGESGLDQANRYAVRSTYSGTGQTVHPRGGTTCLRLNERFIHRISSNRELGSDKIVRVLRMRPALGRPLIFSQAMFWTERS